MSNNDELELDVRQNKFVNSNGQWLLVVLRSFGSIKFGLTYIRFFSVNQN